MATTVNADDPRVKRTRQLLLQAFVALFEERKNIHSILVNEIAERATVNRATFYAHFADKYALFEAWISEKFQQMLIQELPPSASLATSTLRLLIGTVFDIRTPHYHLEPADKQFEIAFDMALQEELYDLLLSWLNQLPSELPTDAGLRETTAQIISWAICGPAAKWSRGDRIVSAEEMTQRVLIVVIAALSPIICLEMDE